MNREDVYKLIDGEREYQNSLGADRRGLQQHSVGDYITMLHHYMTELDKAWTKNPGTIPATDVIRKIAGIAVRCMEEHPTPERWTSLGSVKSTEGN